MLHFSFTNLPQLKFDWQQSWLSINVFECFVLIRCWFCDRRLYKESSEPDTVYYGAVISSVKQAIGYCCLSHPGQCGQRKMQKLTAISVLPIFLWAWHWGVVTRLLSGSGKYEHESTADKKSWECRSAPGLMATERKLLVGDQWLQSTHIRQRRRLCGRCYSSCYGWFHERFFSLMFQ